MHCNTYYIVDYAINAFVNYCHAKTYYNYFSLIIYIENMFIYLITHHSIINPNRINYTMEFL